MNTVSGLVTPPVDDLVKLCRRHRLFINGWTMGEDLAYYFDNKNHILGGNLYYQDGIPIAATLIVHRGVSQGKKKCQVQVFVRKAHRRKGIATKLVEALDLSLIKAYCELGVDHSEKFWYNTNIPLM